MLVKSDLLILFVTFLSIASSRAANILGIFHYPSYSHQIVYQSLVNDLSERGHHLTILTTDRMKSKNPNITEIYLENSYEENINFVESRDFGSMKLYYEGLRATMRRLETQFNQPEVRDLIENHENYKFDVIILEYLFMTPLLGFAELYDCPVIGISAIGVGAPVHELMGNPVNPTVHSEFIFPYQHGRLKFTERICSFLYFMASKFLLQPSFEIIGGIGGVIKIKHDKFLNF